MRYATYAVLGGAGALAGVIGTFLVPQQVGRFGYLSSVVAVGGNLMIGMIGGWGTGRVGGALAPFSGWFIAVGMLATEPFVARGGDVVIPGSLGSAPGVVHAAWAFMGLGVVASIVPILLTSRYTARVNPPKSLS